MNGLTRSCAAPVSGQSSPSKVPHVFQSFAGILDEADEAIGRAAIFLRQRVRG